MSEEGSYEDGSYGDEGSGDYGSGSDHDSYHSDHESSQREQSEESVYVPYSSDMRSGNSDRQSYHSDRSHHSDSESYHSHHSGSESGGEGGGGGGGGFLGAAAGGLLGGAAGGKLGKMFGKIKLGEKKDKHQYEGGSAGYGSQGQGHAPPGGGYSSQPQMAGYGGGPGDDQRDLYQDQYMPPSAPPQGYHPSGAGFNPGNNAQYGSQHPPDRFGNQNFHQADGREQGQVKQYFEYSTCQGNRKALLIGINYFGQSGELAGCINDALNVKQFLCERFGYQPADIVVLTDDSRDPRGVPTKANIIRAMGWLVDGAHKDDSLFFHYSGHGTQTEDLDGDEGDDDDEAICPVDYHESGLIVDDDSDHEMLVKPLPAGCRLTAIFDSCHSGTVMDLPYVYTTDGKIKEPNLLSESGDELMSAGVSLLSGNTAGAMSSLFGAAKGAFDMNRAHQKTKKTKTSPADVIMWSGCKDDQTSADTQEEGAATGAMSYAFISSLRKYPRQSYQQLLQTIREELKGKYSQKPQLSACHPIDVDLEFVA